MKQQHDTDSNESLFYNFFQNYKMFVAAPSLLRMHVWKKNIKQILMKTLATLSAFTIDK